MNAFDVIAWIVQAYIIVLIVRALFSWIPISSGSPFAGLVHLLAVVTEPVLRPVRRLLPPVRAGGMGLDVSFIVVLVALEILVYILHRL
jgi:YggT family protein